MMMSHTGCENMLGGHSIGPNDNISINDHGAVRKCAEGAGDVHWSVWPVISLPFVDVESEMGCTRRCTNHFETNRQRSDLVNQLDTGLTLKTQ